MSKIKIFALGGLNENGKNMYVVEVDHNIFIFDAGLKYGTDKMLGVNNFRDIFTKNTQSLYGIPFLAKKGMKLYQLKNIKNNVNVIPSGALLIWKKYLLALLLSLMNP